MRPTAPEGEKAEEAQREVTERIERQEFARGNIGPSDEPARPRHAATIVLARETPDTGFEVLLLKRPATSRFAAGAYVFPGGKIDAGDSDASLAPRMPRTGPDAEPEAVLAALRELFEETGLLLADRRPLDSEESDMRRRLLADAQSFGDAAAEHDLSFSGTHVCYFARWVTPARFARRYDTRFFLAELPADRAGFTPELTDEISGYLWVTPAEAVEMFRSGRLPMLFPTRVTLQALAEFASIADVFEVFSGRRIEPLTPRLLIRGDSIRPVLPGDPEYDDADG
ncbi:MAG: NUDIX hydrolase [Gemmatimonadota bacterium]